MVLSAGRGCQIPSDERPVIWVLTHARAWGRPVELVEHAATDLVSIHAPVWGRHSPPRLWTPLTSFRSTPPYGGDLPQLGRAGRGAGFDPRPRMGATRCLHGDPPAAPVSIHAPVWGRHLPIACRWWPRCFDPRPRMGATLLQWQRVFVVGVSIHAPVWGRRSAIDTGSIMAWFRSTPPYGGDARASANGSYSTCFDPRPRMGATGRLPAGGTLADVSIHAPVWGRRGVRGVRL